MSDRRTYTCSDCGEEGHNTRTCPHSAEQEDDFSISESDEDCLYELGGIYCPECHRGN